jgi:hypothetical protein
MRVKGAIGLVTIFLLAISIVSALSCTLSGFGFSTTHGQMSLKMPEGMEAAEGYVLSKYSDYSSDDREYTRNDTLYVWVWSYRIDPYHLMENYCQLKLGEYEHTFEISYHPNMTRQYSYVGSFKLSRLEKTGDWEVQIFLKSKPKPPPASYEPKDVIHVSDVTPPAPSGLWPAVMPFVVPMGLLALFGVTAYIIVRGRQRRAREEIKETEYRITLEVARLEAALQGLDTLLEKGVISRERYEAMRRKIEDELTRIRGLKS